MQKTLTSKASMFVDVNVEVDHFWIGQQLCLPLGGYSVIVDIGENLVIVQKKLLNFGTRKNESREVKND